MKIINGTELNGILKISSLYDVTHPTGGIKWICLNPDGWIKQHNPLTCNLVTCLECHTSDGKTVSAIAICLWISIVVVFVLQFIFPFSLTRFKTSFPYQELSSWTPKTPHRFCKSSLWFIISRNLLQNLFMVNTQSPNFSNTFLSFKSLSPSVSHAELAAPLVSLLSLSPLEDLMPDSAPKRLVWDPWLLPHCVWKRDFPHAPWRHADRAHGGGRLVCLTTHFTRQSPASCASLKTNEPELQPLGS